MVDARYEKVRVDGKVISQAVLVVMGFTARGQAGDAGLAGGRQRERADLGRGVPGAEGSRAAGVKLVVSDAHSGIRAAISRHFQGVAWQRCRVHFKREMGKKVSYKKLKELKRDLAAVFAGEDKAECVRRGEEMAVKWEKAARGGGDAAGGAGGLPDGGELPRAPPPAAAEHEPAGEHDEAAEEADAGGGRVPQPRQLATG